MIAVCGSICSLEENYIVSAGTTDPFQPLDYPVQIVGELVGFV